MGKVVAWGYASLLSVFVLVVYALGMPNERGVYRWSNANFPTPKFVTGQGVHLAVDESQKAVITIANCYRGADTCSYGTARKLPDGTIRYEGFYEFELVN